LPTIKNKLRPKIGDKYNISKIYRKPASIRTAALLSALPHVMVAVPSKNSLSQYQPIGAVESVTDTEMAPFFSVLLTERSSVPLILYISTALFRGLCRKIGLDFHLFVYLICLFY
jgi:hypothetical protein